MLIKKIAGKQLGSVCHTSNHFKQLLWYHTSS